MIIDGNKIANGIAESLKFKVKGLKRPPKLAIILVGNNPASKIYVDLKVKKASEIGIETEVRTDLNTDADGIIVQLPGPEELVQKIPPEKDVDGLTPNSKFLPATVKAVLTLADSHGTWVVVGQGRLVGKPLADYLEKQGEKVIRCDVNTKNLQEETLKGDVLVVATGIPNLIKADMVKPGAIVIDCGSPKPEVDFENVKDVAAAITPVPGGVGPLTVVSLLANTVEAAYNSLHEKHFT